MAFTVNKGNTLEVVFSFDTTGSMYECLEQVRGRIQDMIQRLQGDIPGIRFAVFAHGDYCDDTTYITKHVDFTTDIVKLMDFVNNAERTGGGDAPECYELVMRKVRTELSWTPGSKRVFVLIGDDEPHGPDYPLNTQKIDWKSETKLLALEGITIYGVQCQNSLNAALFYKTISEGTGGRHLKLDDFGNLFDVLMAVCYREGTDTSFLESYEKEVRARNNASRVAPDIDALFETLKLKRGTSAEASPVPRLLKKTSSLTPVRKPLGLKKMMMKSKLPSKTSVKSSVCRKSNGHPVKRLTGLAKYQQKNLPLLRRENVPERNFSMSFLNWSPWNLAICSEVPSGHESEWEPRRNRPGHRVKVLTTKSKMTHDKHGAFFEVSVQAGGSRKPRYVVYSAFSSRCLGNFRWERTLLRGVQFQVDRLVRDGYNVFVRHCVLVSSKDLCHVRENYRRYDYAWRKIRYGRQQGRAVVKGRSQISVALC